MNSEALESRLRQYATQKGCDLGSKLGEGNQGIVWNASDKRGMSSAIKIHRYRDTYDRERDCYLRLATLNLIAVKGLNVPQLLGHSDEFRIIEMTIVKRPFLLDFAGAFLDEAPDFTNEAWEMRHEELREWFEDDYATLLRVLHELRIHGIHLTDPHPGNIAFR